MQVLPLFMHSSIMLVANFEQLCNKSLLHLLLSSHAAGEGELKAYLSGRGDKIFSKSTQ